MADFFNKSHEGGQTDLSIGYSLVYMQCCLLQQFATICNNPRWRAVARYKSVLSLQEANDFFRDVFPHEDQTGTHDGLLVKEIIQTRQCMHKNAREIRPPWEGRESHKSREKMIDALVGKWYVADGRWEAEFIASFRLSRPSFAKLSNQLRPLLIK